MSEQISTGVIENIFDTARNSDGSINWRKLIPNEFLYVNKEYFERRREEVPSSIEGLEDNQLLVKLGGLKYVAKLRGYKNVEYKVVKAKRKHVVVVCSISWYNENGAVYGDGPVQTYDGIGSAHIDNTNEFMHNFLEAAAENRAFVRAVRNYLNINIVGDDEIKKTGKAIAEEKPTTSSSTDPKDLVKSEIIKKGIDNSEDFTAHLERVGAPKEFIDKFRDVPSINSALASLEARETKALLSYLRKK